MNSNESYAQGRHKRVALSQMRQASKVDGHNRPPNFKLCVDKKGSSNILSLPIKTEQEVATAAVEDLRQNCLVSTNFNQKFAKFCRKCSLRSHALILF